GDLVNGRSLSVDRVLAVTGAEDEAMELVQLPTLVLLPGCQRAPEHLEAAAGVRVRLLPELPLRTLLGVHLLEWEIAPVDLEVIRADLITDIPDPLCCAERQWAEEIKIKVN